MYVVKVMMITYRHASHVDDMTGLSLKHTRHKSRAECYYSHNVRADNLVRIADGVLIHRIDSQRQARIVY